jgi:hypothetical protein
MPRPIHQIAAEVRKDWFPIYFAARPYLDAMRDLDSIKDSYGQDPAVQVVSYFLSNAASWKGETARRVKAELKALIKEVKA